MAIAAAARDGGAPIGEAARPGLSRSGLDRRPLAEDSADFVIVFLRSRSSREGLAVWPGAGGSLISFRNGEGPDVVNRGVAIWIVGRPRWCSRSLALALNRGLLVPSVRWGAFDGAAKPPPSIKNETPGSALQISRSKTGRRRRCSLINGL